jgi:hypothetical protein
LLKHCPFSPASAAPFACQACINLFHLWRKNYGKSQGRNYRSQLGDFCNPHPYVLDANRDPVSPTLIVNTIEGFHWCTCYLTHSGRCSACAGHKLEAIKYISPSYKSTAPLQTYKWARGQVVGGARIYAPEQKQRKRESKRQERRLELIANGVQGANL